MNGTRTTLVVSLQIAMLADCGYGYKVLLGRVASAYCTRIFDTRSRTVEWSSQGGTARVDLVVSVCCDNVGSCGFAFSSAAMAKQLNDGIKCDDSRGRCLPDLGGVACMRLQPASEATTWCHQRRLDVQQ